MAIMIPVSLEMWKQKYKAKEDITIRDTWNRVSDWVADNEKDFDYWRLSFGCILEDNKFIPGGRITESAGTEDCYANNCFALDIEDDIENIYETVKNVAVISKRNGGVGINFSKIRPSGSSLSNGGVGSGVVSFMKIFDTSCSVIKTGSKNRRAALIGLLDCDHPEIFEFIDAKREEDVLTNFNISVCITDKFIDAVKNDSDWDLKFNNTVYKTIKARELWDKLCYSGWMYNDPGLFFVDNVNRTNNLYYIQSFQAVNPCGELPLFPWGACCLGNVNTTRFVKTPFKDGPIIDLFDFIGYKKAVRIAVRFLDNVIDVSKYPYEKNKEIAQRDRRIGLNGLAGIGSTLAMLCIPYDNKEGRDFASMLSKICRDEAYRESIEIAKEKGAFLSLDIDKYCRAEFIKSLPEDIRNDIYKYGIRNSALLTCPPVGTGSMLAGNISSGIEPIFALEYYRNIKQNDGTLKEELMEDFAWRLYKELYYDNSNIVPSFFKTAMQIDPKDHILMQAAIQEYVDGSISKTCNLPKDYTLDQYKELLMFSYENNLKGWTTFRNGTREGVLSIESKKTESTKKETIVEFERPRALDAKVYQILESTGNHTYCTISSVNDKPWEMFMNASGDNAEWYAVIGRLASRLMRKTGDAAGVIKELKSIGGDNGYFTQDYGFVKSKPQHLGYILEEYVESLRDINSETIAAPEPKYTKTLDSCEECGGAIVKRGGCKECENHCLSSFKCG